MSNKLKGEIQKDVLNAWWKKGGKGTAECATGFGKCRVGVLASSHIARTIFSANILIVVPTTAISDEWTKEFYKWKESKTFNNNVKIECINTARKFKNEHYDLVICDEIHNYINGEKNLEFFKNNTWDKILGLSATIEISLLDSLNKIAPICYTLNLYQAVELGLISDFTVYNIPVKLSTAERKMYDELSSKIAFSWERYGKHSWKNISLRKNILYTAKAKMRLLEKIIDIFDTSTYGIVFSMTKDYSNSVKKTLGEKCLVHHSGITKKKRIETLKKFSDNRTKSKILSSAKTLDEGVSLPRLEYGVIMASSSKFKQMMQRAGRVLRMDVEGKHAIIIRLYCQDTKENDWLDSSQSNLKVINVKNITELKKLINKV